MEIVKTSTVLQNCTYSAKSMHFVTFHCWCMHVCMYLSQNVLALYVRGNSSDKRAQKYKERKGSVQ